ncbi:hypothetical protein [Lacisediminihabitans sp.]|uniref:hypothetical protein n=1 Tax=Lacisediminihabitans sp. TaxID=2787631 RepID=UPI00374DE90E
MIDAQRGVAPRQFSWADFLLRWGVLLIIVGSVAGLAAKFFADRASHAASGATRMLTPDASEPIASHIAQIFDPSSAHYVPPDYTAFWIGMLAVALGVAAVAAGIGVVVAKRRAG